MYYILRKFLKKKELILIKLVFGDLDNSINSKLRLPKDLRGREEVQSSLHKNINHQLSCAETNILPPP